MPHPYFCKTEVDRNYYQAYLQDRLPEKILDMHSHMNLPEHLENIPQARIDGDWALQAGYQMTAREAGAFARELFETVSYSFVGFPFPIREADLAANNRYISACISNGEIEAGLMVVTPDMDAQEVGRRLTEGGFAGLKPYPDLVGAQKGAEIGIFDFLPREQIEAAWKLHKCILLHLPRANRLADENNGKELREIVTEFPGIKLIVAHLGRCYNPCYWERGLELLGPDVHKLWFDTAGVMNPEVLRPAFSLLDPARIMFGLDLPIFLWHGTRRWTETGYQNLCRENLPWKREADPPEVQEQYPFFVYEELKNLLSAMRDCGWGQAKKEGFFHHNAAEFFRGCGAAKDCGPEKGRRF